MLRLCKYYRLESFFSAPLIPGSEHEFCALLFAATVPSVEGGAHKWIQVIRRTPKLLGVID